MVQHIPFLDRFKKPLNQGTKTMTSRTKRYGQPGDRFIAFAMRFEITHVDELTLGEVAEHYFLEEGVSSPEEFKQVWAEIHPKKGFDADQFVYVHTFKQIGWTDP